MIKKYFTRYEITLWASSIIIIAVSFFACESENYLTLIASLVGATSLIFNAKGNPIGQFIMIVFSIIYGIISFSFCYYGEMITYLGMTGPMAFLALISWIKHPYKGNKSVVLINNIKIKEYFFMCFLTVVVTIIFYFILKEFNTANLYLSTLSVSTSFIAVYLTFRRSKFFAIAYALNDVVLIVLWILATFKNNSYFSVVICFVIFLINDIYGFINWTKMHKNQQQ